MEQFRVNKCITLKLEQNITNIYLNNELFDQCKFLLLTIPIEGINDFDDIKSIDDASEVLNKSAEEGAKSYVSIPPKVEFWGHCSNLQVWFEHNYNSRLLHRNLAFPLLKRLTEIGDPLAKKVFKEEIAERFKIGNETVKNYLIEEEYLNYLSREEFWNLFDCNTLPLQELEVLLKEQLKLVPYFDEFSPVPVFKIKNNKIVALQIINSDLEELPESIGELKSLEELFLYCNKIKSLPETFGELILLKKLHLQVNRLEILPHSISNLVFLKELYIEGNNLKEVPDSIGNLVELEILGLGKNQLEHISEAIGKLRKLKELNLDNNNLKELPESICQLNVLKNLCLEDNKIMRIQESILSIKSLKYLILRKNPCFKSIKNEYSGKVIIS